VLRDAFTAAVRKRMMSDVPFGVLLSGGLDSSLVASIASRIMKEVRGGGRFWCCCYGADMVLHVKNVWCERRDED